MKRRLIATALIGAVAFFSACGSDNKTTTEPPPPEAPDTVQLEEGGAVGKATFPDGNGQNGGDGNTIDGVACDTRAPVSHIHLHLSLYVNGEQIAIPKGIGVKDPQVIDNAVIAGTCFYWLHTHDATGIIHVEPAEAVETNLGQFFDIWGQPLSKNGVAGYQGDVTVLVDGKEYTGDPRAIPFEAHQQIALEVGTPLVTPTFYLFPSGY